MKFKVKLRTSGGGKREVELPATSVQDAIDQINQSYPGCTILGTDLMPSNINSIRIYDHGQQTKCNKSLIYHPFKD